MCEATHLAPVGVDRKMAQPSNMLACVSPEWTCSVILTMDIHASNATTTQRTLQKLRAKRKWKPASDRYSITTFRCGLTARHTRGNAIKILPCICAKEIVQIRQCIHLEQMFHTLLNYPICSLRGIRPQPLTFKYILRWRNSERGHFRGIDTLRNTFL